ncbi:hypothetical protein [Halomonas elongata]|uniref:hypothetical protein n=1 Tax=Halomonas elongata TaxID=2746 RepID=UPI004033256D
MGLLDQGSHIHLLPLLLQLCSLLANLGDHRGQIGIWHFSHWCRLEAPGTLIRRHHDVANPCRRCPALCRCQHHVYLGPAFLTDGRQLLGRVFALAAPQTVEHPIIYRLPGHLGAFPAPTDMRTQGRLDQFPAALFFLGDTLSLGFLLGSHIGRRPML